MIKKDVFQFTIILYKLLRSSIFLSLSSFSSNNRKNKKHRQVNTSQFLAFRKLSSKKIYKEKRNVILSFLPSISKKVHVTYNPIRSRSTNDTLVAKGVPPAPSTIRVIPRIRRKLRGYLRRKREFSNCYPQPVDDYSLGLAWGEATHRHTCRI